VTDPFPLSCQPFDLAMRLLDRRWAAAVVRAMLDGAERFGEIRARLPGVTDAVLTSRLRELCAWGIAVRDTSGDDGRAVSYRLTDAGCELAPVLDAVETYGAAHGELLGRIEVGRRPA
jgi:DNA-binding HxlR family transcriptional regulator